MKNKEQHPPKDPKKKLPTGVPGKPKKPVKVPKKTKKPAIEEPQKSYDKNKLKLY